ncbi:MAG: hypothetical protein ABFD12_09860 [Syntrophorhabdus sp.]
MVSPAGQQAVAEALQVEAAVPGQVEAALLREVEQSSRAKEMAGAIGPTLVLEMAERVK